MSVNLRRFVNLNVSRIKRNATNPVRDTVAVYGASEVFTSGLVTNTVFTSASYTYDKSGAETAYVLSGYNYANKNERRVLSINASAFSTDKFYTFAKHFFQNGGAKLHVYVGVATANAETGKLEVGGLTIPDEEIAVAGLGQTVDAINALAASYNNIENPINPSDEGSEINLHTSSCKVFFASTDETDLDDVTNIQENVGVKHCKQGVEASILAYLSRINPYGENTVNQYAFTIEDIDEDSIYNEDPIVGTCMQNFINVDSYLSKAIRNVGGDLATGFDIVNYYVTIIMQQTVEEAIMNVLSDKLAGAEGTAVIYNTAVSELNKYVQCGLFAAGNWENVTWSVEFNGEEYVVVNANERLTLGYKLMVIPFAAMTQEQVTSHACPPIYLAMTNAYGIRKVTINGEVR